MKDLEDYFLIKTYGLISFKQDCLLNKLSKYSDVITSNRKLLGIVCVDRKSAILMKKNEY